MSKRFQIIETNKECFIRIVPPYTFYPNYYIFDGKKAEPTRFRDWFKLDKVPEVLEVFKNDTTGNQRFELKSPDKFPNLKLVYAYSEVLVEWDEDDLPVFTSEFEEIKSLYNYKVDTIPGGKEQVDFEIVSHIKAEIPDDTFSYDILVKRNYQVVKETLTGKEVQYDLVHQLVTPEPLLPYGPCQLSAQQSFDVVRKYIKDNIDRTRATITSDYDFCLTVKKVVPCKPYKIKRDVSKRNARKPKYEEFEKDYREYTVYKIAPKPYQTYPVLTPFKGNNLKELDENIKEYLKDLMETINAPVKECPHCDGYGFLKEKI